MATRTWTIYKDTSTIAGGGNGADQHAPIGYWAGFVYRYFAQYNVDLSAIASIQSATWHGRATTQVHVGFGSGPTVKARRVTASWVGSGGSEGTWSSSANPVRATDPSTTSTGETTTNMTRTENAWDTADITAIAQAWLAGSANYGLRFAASSEASGADTWECYAQGHSYKSYITIVYTPVVTDTTPSATPIKPLAGVVADVAYPAGCGWASPRPTVSWAFSDPSTGASQSAYQVIVYDDAAGSPGSVLLDTGKVISAVTSLQIPLTFVEGSYYHWKVQVWDNTDLISAAYTATQRFRTRWGVGEYIADLTIAPPAWSLASLVSTGLISVEYNSTTDAADPGAGIGSWKASLADVTKAQYLRYRAWLLPNNAVAPSLDSIVVTYSATAEPAPDHWTFSAGASIDQATMVYGTRSLRIDATGSDERTYQLVQVLPDTLYQLSGRIKQTNGAGGYLALGASGAADELVSVPGSLTAVEWTAVSVPWNSGARTNVYVQCGVGGTGSAWFDAIKLEASDVVTAWSPNVMNASATVDASGLKIDAAAGGTLRLQGSAGTDVVTLGANGLELNGAPYSVSGVAANVPTSTGTLADVINALVAAGIMAP